MKNKILIACIISVIIILLPSTVAFNEIVNQDKPDKVKYLAIGFFPDIRGEWCIYYIIPGIIWATVHYDQLTIIWLGQFIIIGITSERPEYGFGKIP
jgi:hypothetical protein